MYATALAEDPNAFEYDSLYDSMQEQRAAPKQQEKLARQPKYIASLLEQAEVRKREAGITHERILVRGCACGCAVAALCWSAVEVGLLFTAHLTVHAHRVLCRPAILCMLHCCHSLLPPYTHTTQLKERQKEYEQWGDTEKFVTAAYKRKLEEDRQWQESQRLKCVLYCGLAWSRGGRGSCVCLLLVLLWTGAAGTVCVRGRGFTSTAAAPWQLQRQRAEAGVGCASGASTTAGVRL